MILIRKPAVKSLIPLMLLCWSFVFANAAGAADTAPTATVRTQRLQRAALADTLRAYGTILPDADALTNISFPRAGQITRLRVAVGQVVKRGTPLLDFRTDAAATAGYAQAQSAVAFARSELARIQGLAAERLATRSQVAAAQKSLSDAESALEAQRKQGADIKQETLKAGFDAVVTTISAQPGDRIAPGAPVAQLTRAGALRAVLGVEPEDAARVRAGQAVQLISVFDGGQGVAASVAQVHGVINPQTRLVDVAVRIHGQAAGLLPGMQVRGSIVLARPVSWVVPRSAILRDAQGAYLYQVNAGRAVRVNVRTGIETAQQIAVEGALDAQRPVVVRGNYVLRNDMPVREQAP